MTYYFFYVLQYGYELPPSNGDDTVYAFVYFGSSEMFWYDIILYEKISVLLYFSAILCTAC